MRCGSLVIIGLRGIRIYADDWLRSALTFGVPLDVRDLGVGIGAAPVTIILGGRNVGRLGGIRIRVDLNKEEGVQQRED
jgi:hypothetical protein